MIVGGVALGCGADSGADVETTRDVGSGRDAGHLPQAVVDAGSEYGSVQGDGGAAPSERDRDPASSDAGVRGSAATDGDVDHDADTDPSNDDEADGAVREDSQGDQPRDGGAMATASDPDAANMAEPLVAFCAAWQNAVCEIEVDCCASRGYEVSLEVCTLPNRAEYLLQQPICSGWLQTPENFDADAASRCVELVPEFYADCRPAARDTEVFEQVTASCEMIAPQPYPEPGQVCSALPCQAPSGMVSVCDYTPGSGGISECFPPVPAQPMGAECGFDVYCDVDLVCVDGTCVRPLARDAACSVDAHCESGYCDGVCTDAPPIGDARCELMQHLERHALYVEEGVGQTLAVNSDRVVWPGYYGPRGEKLHHAPKDGTGPIVHLTPEGSYLSPTFPLVDESYAYEITDGIVDRTDLDDGSREVLADVGFTHSQLVEFWGDELLLVDGMCSRVSWLSTRTGELREHPESRDDVGSSNYAYAAVDDVAAYCARDRRIVRFDHDGHFATITEEAVEPRGWVWKLVAVDGLLYYMVAGDPIEDRDQPRVIDPNTGEVTKLTPPTPLTSMFADQTTAELFWTAERSIVRYSVRTDSFDTIELPAPTSTNLAFDSDHFYWRFEQGIYRWPRP